MKVCACVHRKRPQFAKNATSKFEDQTDLATGKKDYGLCLTFFAQNRKPMNEVMYLVIGLVEFFFGLVPCGAYNLRHLFDLKLNAASLHKVLAVSTMK